MTPRWKWSHSKPEGTNHDTRASRKHCRGRQERKKQTLETQLSQLNHFKLTGETFSAERQLPPSTLCANLNSVGKKRGFFHFQVCQKLSACIWCQALPILRPTVCLNKSIFPTLTLPLYLIQFKTAQSHVKFSKGFKKKNVAKSSADYPVSCLLAAAQKRVELPLLPAGVTFEDVQMWGGQMWPCFCLIHFKKAWLYFPL